MANDTGPAVTVHSFDPKALERFEVRNGEYVDWVQMVINEPSCVAAFQEFRADERLGYWVMFYDEIHYAISGEADLIYRMPGNYEEEVRLRVKAGDVYLLPLGIETKWEVIGDGPYRTLFVIMPRPRNGFE